MKFPQKNKKTIINPLKISFVLALAIHLFIIIFLSYQISFNNNNQQEKAPTFKIIYISDVVYNTPQTNIQTVNNSTTQEEENISPKNTINKDDTDIDNINNKDNTNTITTNTITTNTNININTNDHANTTNTNTTNTNNTNTNNTNTNTNNTNNTNTNTTYTTNNGNNHDSDVNDSHISIDDDDGRPELDKDTSNKKPFVVNNSSVSNESNESNEDGIGDHVNNNNSTDDSRVEISDISKELKSTALDYQAESIDIKTNNTEKETDIEVNSDDFEIKKSAIEYKSNTYASNSVVNNVIASAKDDNMGNNTENNDLEGTVNTKVDEELSNEEENETLLSNNSNEAVISDIDNQEGNPEKSKVENTVKKKDENKANIKVNKEAKKEVDDDKLIIDLTQEASIDDLIPPTVSSIEQPVYPKELKRRGIEGEVILKLLINEKGKVNQIEIYSSSSFEQFDIEAEKAVKGWKFTPTNKDGTNVMAWILVPIKFKLY